jgi:putative DNA primase/helicase
LRFLARVTGDDPELIAYLQRLCGYALVGEVVEHALIFLYGLGANGKSTFVNTLAGILGNYGQTAPMDTFTETNGSQHPTDLAMLRGARLVTATETEDGKRWASAKIKVLTGGDKIAARFMRQDFFEFKPQFTLVISGNHKPGLRSVDEAMRRRMHLVPFTQTIPAAERDSGLPAKLQAEWPGILTWMIEGCLAWQRTGLNPPQAVTAATEDYLATEDVMSQWLDEATERDVNSFEQTTALHDDYRAWAERAGEKFLGVKRFSQALEDRGLVRGRKSSGKGFTGRGLKTLGQRPWRSVKPDLLS